MAVTQDQYYLSISTPFGADKLLMRHMHGEEHLSRPFTFFLDMYSEASDLDFATIVGKAVTVTVTLPGEKSRYINGVVGRFSQGRTDGRFTIYYAELHPWFWLLTKTMDSRIFQELSVPDIIEKIFGDLGYADYKNSLTGTYTARTYCVQYQETAYDFICRLMEDEGIYYFFTHEDGKHTMVLADAADAIVACPNAATAVFRDDLVNWVDETMVSGCMLEQQVIPGKYSMEDYNFETPETDLIVTSAGTATHRIYEYPGGYTAKDAGEGRSGKRLEAFEVQEKLLRGTSRTAALLAGYKFTLSDHPRADVNAAWALRRVVHDAGQEIYRNEFEAHPEASVFRPVKSTPKPRIAGTQTAVVVGKSGEEIFTDKYGRIKVQFHWDQEGAKDENSSCWIRVAHGWAGKSWGQIFIPRIGQEVVVSFEEGDPDRPLVTGSVYNATQTVPYALPANMTQSTIKSNSSKGGEGSNELRFEDKKDSEEIYLHAQKDLNEVIEYNRTTEIVEEHDALTIKKGNRTVTLDKGNLTTTLKKGNETHKIKGNRALTIDGNQTHTTKKNYTAKVKKNYTLKIDGNLAITVKGNITITGKKNITVKASKGITEKAGKDITQKAGGNLTSKAGKNWTAKAGMNLTAKAGTNATIKGGTNVAIKAGVKFSAKGVQCEVNGSAKTDVKGAMVSVKGSATGTFDGGGMATIKGGLIKVG
ncbi:MAG: type VI secretion system Vgr family protein [Desulfovibrionaceae bacterium]